MEGISWFSRNMILSGSVILAFWDCILGAEMVYKYVEVNPLDSTRYFHELAEKFEVQSVPQFTVCHLSFVLHLLHGFNSSMQSVGFNNKYSKALHKLGYAYAIVIPVGFIFIALFHHFNH
jgi:succinate dehydrogenase / fumarate reductase cytochrome b subunit